MLKKFFISMLGALTAIWISVMMIVVLGMCFAIGSIASSLSSGNSPVGKIEKPTVLCLNLDNSIDERATTPNIYDIINEKAQPQALSDIVNALKIAGEDKNIAGLYISCRGSEAGIATREAIRNAVADFRDTGKWVVAYGDVYSQGDYYIASAAGELYLNPVGMIDIHGLASGIPFFKGFLDKVGVEVQVVKVGTFKSAVEPFTSTHMSEANRMQTSIYLDNIWNGIATSIGEARGIEVNRVNVIADSLMSLVSAQDIVGLNLVNGLKYGNEMTDYLKELTDTDKDDDLPMVTIGDYLQSGVELPNSKSNKNKIAVYYAFGDITENDRDGIASERVVPDILDLAEDDDIDAMVLRVNSGGGSAFASEQIWHALEVFKSKGKTFYVSMGDYAASGGYYISCGAEKIYAQPFTLTGSIGIFGMIPCVKELMSDKLGINMDFVSTNANSAMSGLLEPLTPFQRAKLQQEVNRGYDLFTSRVAEGRKVSQDSIKSIAEGRVWDGISARKIGLVDELGSLSDAIEALAESKGFAGDFEIVEYPKAKDSFWDIVSKMGLQIKSDNLKQELGAYYPIYHRLNSLREQNRLQARMEDTVVF